MSLSRLTKHAALWVSLVTACLCLALAGLGFLVAGFYIWLAQHLNTAAAAAITGGALLALALVKFVAGGAMLKRYRQKKPSPFIELANSLNLVARLAAPLVRRDPKKAIIAALLAGALAEWLLGRTEKKEG